MARLVSFVCGLIWPTIILLASTLAITAAPSGHIVMAKPETDTVAHVGDVVIVPLYDSKKEAYISGNVLRRIGLRRIAVHSLCGDFSGFCTSLLRRTYRDAISDRGEAFLAVKAGRTSGHVILTLPHAEPSASIRTVHLFFLILPRR